MKAIIKWVLPFTVIIGTVCMAWYFTMGGELTFIVRHDPIYYGLNGAKVMYEFRLDRYLKNIQETLHVFEYMIPQFPSRPTVDWNIFNAIPALAQWIFFVINVIIWIINQFIIFPIKLLFYIVLVLLSLLGLSGTVLYQDLSNMFTAYIPYLQYSWVN